MPDHLAGATIQVAYLVNYNCYPIEGMAIKKGGNRRFQTTLGKSLKSHLIVYN